MRAVGGRPSGILDWMAFSLADRWRGMYVARSTLLCFLGSRYGMQLRQIANFYNHLAAPSSGQMLQCQKPMLLKDAQDFEAIIA